VAHVSGRLLPSLAAAVTASLMPPPLQDQPMIFTDGGAFTWRNGDTADAATGVKCMIEQVATHANAVQLRAHARRAGRRARGQSAGCRRADQQLELCLVSIVHVRVVGK
jgi:hypothetical protein